MRIAFSLQPYVVVSYYVCWKLIIGQEALAWLGLVDESEKLKKIFCQCFSMMDVVSVH